MAPDIIVKKRFVDFPPDSRVDDLIEDHAIALTLLRCAEDAPAKRRPVEGSFGARRIIWRWWEEEVGCAGAEVVDDCFVAGCSWFDDLAGE